MALIKSMTSKILRLTNEDFFNQYFDCKQLERRTNFTGEQSSKYRNKKISCMDLKSKMLILINISPY